MPEDAVTQFLLDAGGVFRPVLPPELNWLNLGFGTRLSPDWPVAAVRLRQIHSDRIVLVDEPWNSEEAPEADALISNRPGLMLAVRTADCLPILVADEYTRAVAAVHAGWRGTAAGIAAKTVAEMRRSFGSRPGNLKVWLGPGIGKCCFEVGPEVAVQFTGFTGPANRTGKVLLDLKAANMRQLIGSGVGASRIETQGSCTRCDSTLFHSWRRDGNLAGRMTAAIGLTAAK